METKMFFLDLDGTLLDDRRDGIKAISETNRNALAKAKAEGKILSISTGRLGHKAFHWLKESGLDYAIMSNGSLVWDVKEDKYIRRMWIDADTFADVVDVLEELELAFKVDDKPVAFGVVNDLHWLMADKLNYDSISHYNVAIKDVIKLVIWGRKPEELKPLAKVIMDRVPGVMVTSAERGRTLELTHIEGTKGLGNKFLMDHLGIEKEATMHIGDTMNDFPAIEYVGKFVAMGDAAQEIIDAAEYIGPNHHEAGVAQVIEGNYKKNPFRK